MSETTPVELGPLELRPNPWMVEPGRSKGQVRGFKVGAERFGDSIVLWESAECYPDQDTALAAATEARDKLVEEITGLMPEVRETIEEVIEHLGTYLEENSGVLGDAGSVIERWIEALRNLAARGKP
jgi:hypothetical protein